jgi:hypothetical protein
MSAQKDSNEWIINTQAKYCCSTKPQGTPEWLKLRAKYLVTGTSAYTTTGEDEYCPSTLQLSRQITGEHKKVIDAQTQYNFDRGHYYEPLIRDWFAQSYQRKVSCVGLISPLWNDDLACSVDFLDDTAEPSGDLGIGEIKTAYELYPSLLAKQQGKTFEAHPTPWMPDNMRHIKPSHYWQMQFNMALTRRQYCYYIVHATNTNKTYVEKILWYPQFWDKVMYPSILAFIEYHKKRIATLPGAIKS